MNVQINQVGAHLREWRQRRRLSQLDFARQAIDVLLKSAEPFPALVVDRGWNLVAANAALQPLMSLVTDSTLLQPPVNVMRLSLRRPAPTEIFSSPFSSRPIRDSCVSSRPRRCSVPLWT